MYRKFGKRLLDIVASLIALPFEPAMSVENGLFYRRDAAPHVMDFIDLVRREVSGSLPPEV